MAGKQSQPNLKLVAAHARDMLHKNAYRSNRLICALSEKALNQIGPHLQLVTLKKGARLYGLGEQVEHVYFVTRGLVSLVKTMSDGRTVEIGAIGTEGVTAVNALFGINGALFETIVQVPGTAYRARVSPIRRIMTDDEDVRDLISGYVHVILGQIAQTAACNRLHDTEQRCCRWLLVCQDSVGSNEFLLTQEFLAVMLGVRRASVTQAAGALQKSGLIRYRRGRMTILSRQGLEDRSCECYSTTKHFSDSLLSDAAVLSKA